jgi:integrase
MAKAPFRIKPYRHSRLKFVVRDKLTGKWRRKFFKTEREAKTYVQLKEIELLNQGKEGVMFPTEIRVMAHAASQLLSPYGKTIEDAARFYLKHLEADSRSVPVRQAVEELIANREKAGMTKRYCEDLRIRLGRFIKAFPDRNASTITTKEIGAWLESLGVGPVTRNTFRRDVRTLFSFCLDHKYCTDNPAAATTKAKQRDEEVQVFSVEQMRRLLAASSVEMLPFWAIGAFAGLRHSEIKRLQWSDIDFDDALITVRSGKTPKRFVTMQPNLLAWLQPYRGRFGNVCPDNFRKRSAQDKIAAGLKDEWPVNVLRHSFGSYWLAHFNDINALALQMGNSPAVIEAHYRKIVRPKEAHRYWQIKPVSSSGQSAGKIVSFGHP